MTTKPNILDTFEYKTIETSPATRFPAWCNGDLAAINFSRYLERIGGPTGARANATLFGSSDAWSIINLWDGTIWGGAPIFLSIEFCAAAILDLNKLNPSWAFMPESKWEPLQHRVALIFQRYQAIPLEVLMDLPPPNESRSSPPLNGYRRH